MTRTSFFQIRRLLPVALGLLLIACTPARETARKTRKGCLDCHPKMAEKFTAGKAHEPLEKCGKCHRPHGLVGGVYLRKPPPALCYQCHAELARKLQAIAPAKRHAPVATGNCGACHDPHNAPGEGLLKKNGEQLCFECHQAEEFERKIRHQPLEKGCGTCHQPHAGKFPGLLESSPDELCRRCHDTEDQGFRKRHGDYPVAGHCLNCHEVHSADNPGLLKAVTHNPVKELACGDCHREQQAKTPFALQKKGAELCRECHDTESLAAANPDAHPPVAEGKCLKCHDPHASRYPGMTRRPLTKLCLECHQFDRLKTDKQGEVKATPGSGSLHQPLAENGCLACHQAHLPEPGQKQLLKAESNALCGRCHADISQPAAYPHPPATEGRCDLCHLPHESLEPGLLKVNQRRLCAECHENVDREMADSSLHPPFARGNCSGCHTPHGGAQPRLLVTESQKLCGRCHQEIEEERSKEHRHQPFAEGNCRLCHEVHAAGEPFLLKGDGRKICLDCHQEYADGGPDRPVTHAPVAAFNCQACHNAHGSDQPAFLLQKEPGLCLRCHQVNRYWDQGRAHQPAAEGQCESCHQPHFSRRAGLLDRSPAELCAQCHKFDEAGFKAKHQGIGPGRHHCLECHDPHGSPEPGLLLPVGHKPFLEGRCQACHNEVKP